MAAAAVGTVAVVETIQGEGNDWDPGPLWGEGDAGNPYARVKTPEDVAREFIRDGGVVVNDYSDDGRYRPRRSIVYGVIAAIVVLGTLAAIRFLPARAVAHRPISTSKSSHVSHKTVITAIPTTTTTSTSTSASLPANSAVTVQVLNASVTDGVAGLTAAALKQDGFVVGAVGNAPSKITPGQPSEILYGPAGISAAHKLDGSLNGPVNYVASPSLTGTNVTLWIANAQLTVIPQSNDT
jgi:hypothetical protein